MRKMRKTLCNTVDVLPNYPRLHHKSHDAAIERELYREPGYDIVNKLQLSAHIFHPSWSANHVGRSQSASQIAGYTGFIPRFEGDNHFKD